MRVSATCCLQVGVEDDDSTRDKTALQRFFERELSVAGSMVKMIRKDLNDLKTVANGEARSTDRTRAIQASLLKGEVPPIWLKYPIPEITVNAWVRTQPRHPNSTHLCMRAVARASPMTRLVTWALLLSGHGLRWALEPTR